VLPDWSDPVARYVLERGLRGTLQVAAIAVVGSSLIGVLLGTAMTLPYRLLRAGIRLYIEVFRGLPILVTVFIVYFGLPSVASTLRFGPLTAAGIALILWGSAQVAEATRGAVQSIPREQHEAAAALGFGWTMRHAYVIVPQAVRRLLPPLIGLLVNIVQNTTIAGLIGVGETLETGTRSTERLLFSTGNAHYLSIYLAVFVFFFLLSYPLTRLGAFVEKRLAA